MTGLALHQLQLDDSIEYVRVQWVDLHNTIRFRVLTREYFLHLLQAAKAPPGISITKSVLGLVFLTCAPGFGAVGEYLYAFDLASLRRCIYAEGHAALLGTFLEKHPGPNGIRTPSPLCPRTNLARLTALAAQTSARASFLVGVETELILLTSTNPPEPVNTAGWSNSTATPSGSVAARAIQDIASACSRAGVKVLMYHSEAAPGQYEIVTGPMTPLEAADALVHTREAIYNVAASHGLRATLAPRLFPHSCGSAAHTHVSVRSGHTSPSDHEAPSTTHPSTLTHLQATFLKGLLDHLPAALAFTLPTRASYARMVDGVWSGGTYVAWGAENREVPVRLCRPPSNAATAYDTNFELKPVDGTSSPYLAIGAIIAAGLIGIRAGEEVREPNYVGETLVGAVGEEEWAGLCAQVGGARNDEPRARRRLPTDLGAARAALADDAAFREAMGPELVDAYLGVNQTLDDLLNEGTEAEIVTRLVENF
ncbi:hypothetical protein BJ138DRAFT_1085578 [Hygrophoropsis aurantiaca]|uniref:Uncharacterized protein n=1 Tax=Hygrophoropsis aurantiaca TaxID=72124 RepID=A0ACB8AF10_9AGAM|nr:hypothetical protein BJ138DRAFT_1085578 [Hygrophoropsis aurantiaca]